MGGRDLSVPSYASAPPSAVQTDNEYEVPPATDAPSTQSVLKCYI